MMTITEFNVNLTWVDVSHNQLTSLAGCQRLTALNGFLFQIEFFKFHQFTIFLAVFNASHNSITSLAPLAKAAGLSLAHLMF